MCIQSRCISHLSEKDPWKKKELDSYQIYLYNCTILPNTVLIWPILSTMHRHTDDTSWCHAMSYHTMPHHVKLHHVTSFYVTHWKVGASRSSVSRQMTSIFLSNNISLFTHFTRAENVITKSHSNFPMKWVYIMNVNYMPILIFGSSFDVYK